MKNIEQVYPIAEALTADFERERGAQLTHRDRVTAYMIFLDLEYNRPRPLPLRVLVNRHEDDPEFSEQIAADALAFWNQHPAKR
ncbi:hypothetical protein [Citrobacter portucalensis]|uniref:hypothetical protein n=1 Tax=Citrobacter portucalensis TaxID=1639133 RepID=UPI00226B054E|nr:hypothetical protein [Citrobacter portucalensis]MCX8985135.1 hypothetical protein [Citrobacter portucalensis]